MSISSVRSIARMGSVTLMVVGVLSVGSLTCLAGKPGGGGGGGGGSHVSSGGGGSHAGGGGGGSHMSGGGGGSHMSGGGGASHGSMGGGASHGAMGGGSHGPSANGSHGPSAGGGMSHGPSAGGGHGPTAGGAVGGGHSMGGPAGPHAGAMGGGPGGNHANGMGGHNPSAIHSSSAAPRGGFDHSARSGNAVRTRPNGRVSDVHDSRRGMDVHHGMNGNRRISSERPGHGRMVSERGRRGYSQRGYNHHGHEFGRRGYYYHGHEYNRYYRGYGYRGLYLDVYAPGYYYGPGFYGWAYNPWARPITFGWGWGGSPWYGYYGGYFQPYPVYPSAAYWLTDYIIAQDLQTAYAAHQEAGEVDGAQMAAGGPPAMTQEVKDMIAAEVKAQLALENQEATLTAQHQDVDPASSGIARMLADGHSHMFVAGSALDLTDADGQECGISDGDALELKTAPPADATAADLVVLASKGGTECQKNAVVTVQLADLQEMQNHLRETIDQGLQDLQAKQGKDGLPPAPPSAQAKPVEAEYAAAAPPPDPTEVADLQQQNLQADQAEKDVTGEVSQESGVPISVAPSAPATVEVGESLDQVQAIMGAPARVANLGSKVIYYYSDKKVTFKDGKVSDVQ